MSFLKNIWKNNSKHKKLSEEWVLAKNNKENETDLSTSLEDVTEEEDKDVSYKLKYIGSTVVDRPTNETVTAEAIKTILRVAKASRKKLPRVTVTVSLKGIKIKDDATGKENDISIYRISFCSADASHSRVFAFIAANSNEMMECHAFLSGKRKQAQAVTLAVARAFSMAYEAWRIHPSSTGKETNIVPEKLTQLIDLEDFDSNDSNGILIPRPQPFQKNDWVSFDDDNEIPRWTPNQQIDLICS